MSYPLAPLVLLAAIAVIAFVRIWAPHSPEGSTLWTRVKTTPRHSTLHDRGHDTITVLLAADVTVGVWLWSYLGFESVEVLLWPTIPLLCLALGVHVWGVVANTRERPRQQSQLAAGYPALPRSESAWVWVMKLLPLSTGVAVICMHGLVDAAAAAAGIDVTAANELWLTTTGFLCGFAILPVFAIAKHHTSQQRQADYDALTAGIARRVTATPADVVTR